MVLQTVAQCIGFESFHILVNNIFIMIYAIQVVIYSLCYGVFFLYQHFPYLLS